MTVIWCAKNHVPTEQVRHRQIVGLIVGLDREFTGTGTSVHVGVLHPSYRNKEKATIKELWEFLHADIKFALKLKYMYCTAMHKRK